MVERGDGAVPAGPATAWATFLEAPVRSDSRARRALQVLTQRAWRPVCVYLGAIRPGNPIEASRATDRLLRELALGSAGSVRPELRLRFRLFVKAWIDTALKDGLPFPQTTEAQNRTTFVPLEDSGTDLLATSYPPDTSPEELFHAEWLRTMAGIALQTLKRRLTLAGKEGLWTVLSAHDVALWKGESPNLTRLAARLKASALGARLSLALGRTLWRRVTLNLIEQTVADPADAEAELNDLLARCPTWGPAWPRLREILALDDDFLLLKLHMEREGLRSDQLKKLTPLLKLPSSLIGERLVEWGLLDERELHALREKKEETVHDLLHGLMTSRRARLPEVPAAVREAARKPGRRVGRYVCLEPLGKGATGTVWKAWDTQTGESLAVKIFENVPFSKRMLRYAQLSSRLNHPNIVRVREIGLSDDRVFVAMDLVDGRTLGKEALPVREALRISIDVALAVDYAHSQGVLHRDLKPENVMVNSRGEVSVLDFGIARQWAIDLGGTQDRGVLLGTPRYMAPEQAAQGTPDLEITVDVYGVGAVLFHLLTGRPPLEGENPLQILRKLVSAGPPSLSSIVPDAPEELVRVLDRAMARDRAKRYPSCKALVQDLERLLHTLPAAVLDRKLESPTVPEGRPNYAAAALFWTLFTIGLLAAVIYWLAA